MQDIAAIDASLDPLQHIDRFTYILAPPYANSAPEHVLKYLARYLTGGPISDARLIGHENDHVTFSARSGTTPGSSAERQPVTLSGTEFVRCWCMHILLKGYVVKSRRFGGYSNIYRKRSLARCRELLPAADVAASPAELPRGQSLP